jgi:hypothetical protein
MTPVRCPKCGHDELYADMASRSLERVWIDPRGEPGSPLFRALPMLAGRIDLYEYDITSVFGPACLAEWTPGPGLDQAVAEALTRGSVDKGKEQKDG